MAGRPGGTRDGSHYFARTLEEHNANIACANEEQRASDDRDSLRGRRAARETLRGVLDERGLDAILLSRTASKRYFSGFRLGHGEEATAGYSGTLLVTREARLILW